MMRGKILACLAAAALFVVVDAGAQTFQAYPVALLGGMDKVTGRVTTIEVAVGDTAAFGTLQVTPRACRKTLPEETPESAAFLQIDDDREGRLEQVFSGWMFASSPGVSALEHAVYDVWVVDCVAASAADSSIE